MRADSNQVGQPASIGDGIAQGGTAGAPSPDADMHNARGSRPGPDRNEPLPAGRSSAVSREESPVLGTENHGASYNATEASQALDLLDEMFTAYEDGADCYEDPEEQAGYSGKAVKLDDETFHRIADLLNKLRPRATVQPPLTERIGAVDAARRLIDAWESSPLRSHDGRLFDAVADLAQAHGISLTETAQKPRKDHDA